MHIGMGLGFENPEHARSDHAIYHEELALADQAEGLGFESIWVTEHHFTNYQISPDPLQFLTYMAGRTQRVQLGTMAVILPWHDPVRLTERLSQLDTLSNGRIIFGFGRGLGKVEFEGLRIPMEESRERLVETAQIVMRGLESGYVEYDGKYFQQPRREIRPTPIKSFQGRTYAAAVSPESMRIMAELGVGILIVPQKPWESVVQDLTTYRTLFKEVNQREAPPTVVAGYVFCDTDGERAKENAYHYLGAYYAASMQHYGLAGSHLKATKGYEYYGNISTSLNRHGIDEAAGFFANLHVWGTPDQCYEKILAIQSRVGCATFVGLFRAYDFPCEQAERNMRLFASEVMPRLQSRTTGSLEQNKTLS